MANENKNVVYLVKQTQYDIGCSDIGDCYVGTTIYVCSDEQEATRRARKLNEQYGSGCIFTEDWDFDEIDYDDMCDDLHYYEVEEIVVDEPMA